MPEYSDESLVVEALGGSHQAFDQLVKQYQYRVLRTVASIVSNEQAAQDVAQETFLVAWSDLAKLKDKQKFGPWLNQISINLSKLWLRDQRNRQESRVPFEENVITRAQELKDQREKLRQEVWETIDVLAAQYREVVILYYISGYSYKEISQMLSVPVSTIRGRLEQARNQLRKEFLGMVRQLQLEVDSTVHKFLKERAKRDGLSVEGLILRLIQRYKRDIDKPEVAVRQVWESSREPVISDFMGAPSPDGRYLSFINWDQGNLAVRDLTTGEYRDLTHEGTFDEPDQRAGVSIWSPDSKQIAYGWCNDDHWELRIVGLDGSEPRILYCDETIRGSHGVAPFTWSQDGKYILTTFYRTPSLDEEVWEIALVSVGHGSVRVLKSLKDFRHAGRWYWMSLSPDGRQVAYARHVEEHEGARDIFLLATDGTGEEVPLVEHPADDYGPVWAPDGKKVVFASDRSGSYDAWLVQVTDGKPAGEPQLIKRDTGPMKPMGFTQEGSLYYGLSALSTNVYTASMDPATGELLEPPTKAIRQFEGRNHSPAWSPDGKSLAYVSLRPSSGSSTRKLALVIRYPETGEDREFIAKDPMFLQHRRSYIRWSPDGRSILSGRDLQVIDVRTGDVSPIVQFHPADRIGIWGAVWSPDGKAIFYTRVVASGHWPWSIMAHDLGTGKEKELLQGDIRPGLTISPDGRQLAFAGDRSLQVMPTAGGEPRVLYRVQDTEISDLPVACSFLAWTIDGRYVLFVICSWDQPWLTELWRVPAEGGEPQKLLEMDGLDDISPHPDGRRIAFTSGWKAMEVWAMENFLILD